MAEFSIGESFTFFPESHELRRNSVSGSEIIKLEPLLSSLLHVLVSNPDKVILRSNLIQKLWHSNEDVGEPALTKSMFKLRQLFGSEGKTLFETVSKKGYRYNTDPDHGKYVYQLDLGQKINSSYWPIKVLILIILILTVALIIEPNLWHKITH